MCNQSLQLDMLTPPPRMVLVDILFYLCPCPSASHKLLREPLVNFFGRHVFCSIGHKLLTFAMTLTITFKVKL